MKLEPTTPKEEALLERALHLIRFVRHPAFPGLALMAAMILGGFIVLALGWYGVAKITYVALQIPRVVSGGLAGVALIGTGAALLNLQMARRDAAQEQKLTDEILDEVAGLMAAGPQLRAIALRRSPR